MAATPPSSPALIQRVLRPFQQFAHTESSGGMVLLVCTAVALAWANSPWAASYFHLWEFPLAIGVADAEIRLSLHAWINDGLMAVFFLLVGLEIKREVLVGELASLKRAAFPIAAAAGGMVVPALFYVAFNVGTPDLHGWGIPMATDIAFALGILAMLGSRAPLGLKIFLAALAIVDDIGAVLVIALFYSGTLSTTALLAAGGLLVLLVASNAAGIRHSAVYSVLGVLLWYAVHESGIHATVAGVLLAMTIPARTRIDPAEFLERGRAILDEFAQTGVSDAENVLTSPAQQEAIHALESVAEDAQAPLLKMEDKLHGVVAFGIMPLFALANAGVVLAGAGSAFGSPVTLGVIAGLVLGKPIGITLFAWAAWRMGIASIPAITWRQVHGAGWLAGIGFTMSLFIAGLAFESPLTLDAAKIGILAGSLVAGTVGWVLLRGGPAPRMAPERS
jgi:Na+:H+ antiporter, NhaA family